MGVFFGVGYNDANYKVTPKGGPMCKFYQNWKNMLERAYSPRYHIKNPTYKDCRVCEEWLTFSNFKSWMESQDWEGKVLDKDLLVQGNKVYSPETCLFVSVQVNLFMSNGGSNKNGLPTGVHWNKRAKKFNARIHALGSGQKHLGSFDTPEKAHQVWLDEKRKLAVELASMQTDPRVAKALLSARYEDF